jgi:hypothetical protein
LAEGLPSVLRLLPVIHDAGLAQALLRCLELVKVYLSCLKLQQLVVGTVGSSATNFRPCLAVTDGWSSSRGFRCNSYDPDHGVAFQSMRLGPNNFSTLGSRKD